MPLTTEPAAAPGMPGPCPATPHPRMAALAARIERLDHITHRLGIRYVEAADAEARAAGPRPPLPLYDPGDGSFELALARHNDARAARAVRLAGLRGTRDSDVHLDRAQRAGRAMYRACDALADMPATDLPGLILKARTAVCERPRGRLHDSIVSDLLAIGAAAEAGGQEGGR